MKLVWVSSTPLGGPVVPEVYTMVSTSSGRTDLQALSKSKSAAGGSDRRSRVPSGAPSTQIMCSTLPPRPTALRTRGRNCCSQMTTRLSALSNW
ncbi:Uncharacterised protein [Mycobacteroides abscessus subsp. abscessus]|nr:Uncharacterised protein [Mycobacteroides abscessus subsp. abscessus]